MRHWQPPLKRVLTTLRRYRQSLPHQLIEAQTVAIDTLTRIVEMAREPDQTGIDKRNDLLQRVISLPSRVESLKKLTEVDEKIRRGEREAFGITADEGASVEKARVVWIPTKDAD